MILMAPGCSSQTGSLPEAVPREVNPETPGFELLMAGVDIQFNSLVEHVQKLDAYKTTRTYSLSGVPFTGWAYQEFHDSEHRHRFTLMRDGFPEWQIGYFDDLGLGHDFHMKDGYNFGSQKMWHKGGDPYIDTYFLEGELQHGPQKRWTGKNLVRDALFENGTLIYDVTFDLQGNIIEVEGSLPSNYQPVSE